MIRARLAHALRKLDMRRKGIAVPPLPHQRPWHPLFRKAVALHVREASGR